MESGKALRVQFMEAFELFYGERKLHVVQDSAAKSARLLAILLFYYKTGVTREKLLAWLYSDAETDAANSLKALLFRLRKRLRESGLPDCEYVTVRDGVYRFTEEIPVVSDVQQLYDLQARAKAAPEESARVELLQTMLDQYRGELLPALSTELWVVLENAALTDAVIDAARLLIAYWNGKRDYERVYRINRRMSEFLPFDEQWHLGRINALVSLGRYQQAMDEYEAITSMLFDEMGVYPSEQLMDCARKISSNILLPVAAASDVNVSLSEGRGSNGAYYCSYPSFVDSYRVLKRIMERTGISASLLLCTVVDENAQMLTDKRLLVPAIQKLTLALGKALRKSDMFTRYSSSQMLVMLWDCPQQNASISIERIEQTFAEVLSEKRRSVQVTYAVLDGNAPPRPVAAVKKPVKKWKRLP